MNPDTIRRVWTGELDLNVLRVDGEIYEYGKKKLWIQKYLDTCRRFFICLFFTAINFLYVLLFNMKSCVQIVKIKIVKLKILLKENYGQKLSPIWKMTTENN